MFSFLKTYHVYSLRRFKILYTLCGYLLIMPNFTLKENKIVMTNTSKIIRKTVLCALVLLSTYYNCNKILEINNITMVSLLKTITTLLLSLMAILPIYTSYNCFEKWKTYLHVLQKICNTKNLKSKFILYVELITFHIFYIYMLYIWLSTYNHLNYQQIDVAFTAYFLIFQYIIIIHTFLIGNYEEIIEIEWQELNFNLHYFNVDAQLYRFYILEYVFKFKVLSKLVEMHNDLFGRSLFLVIAYPLFRILHVVYVVYYNEKPLNLQHIQAYYLQVSLWMVSD